MRAQGWPSEGPRRRRRAKERRPSLVRGVRRAVSDFRDVTNEVVDYTIASAQLSRQNLLAWAQAFGALAARADILFAEAVLQRGAPLTVVLPVPVDVFLQSSVRRFGRAWVRRCERCLGEAADILEASTDRVLLSGASINLASSIAMGLVKSGGSLVPR